MLQSHQTLCSVTRDVIQLNALIHSQSHNEPSRPLVWIDLILVNMAPSEVSHCAIVIIQTEDILARLRRPYQNLRVLSSVAG